MCIVMELAFSLVFFFVLVKKNTQTKNERVYTGKYLCIVMELAEGGSLGDLIGHIIPQIPHTLRMPASYATHAYLIRYVCLPHTLRMPTSYATCSQKVVRSAI
jgi:hypothetical protein